MSSFYLTRLFRKVSKILSQESLVIIITPDVITDQLLTAQYTYEIYSNYDVLIEIDCKNYSDIYIASIEEKNVLVFLYNSDYDISPIKNLLKKCDTVHYIIFNHENIYLQDNVINFSISKDFARRYIEYLMYDYPQVIISSQINQLLDISGCNLNNIKHLMQLCFNYQKTISQIQEDDILSPYDDTNDSDLILLLSMSSSGIHKKLAKIFIDEEKLSIFLKKQMIFLNDNYIIPNIYLHLYYIKDYSKFEFLKIWSSVNTYVNKLINNEDKTIVSQVVWLLQKTINFQETALMSLKDTIFRIEEALHKFYRYSNNKELQKLEELCEQCFNEGKKVHIYFLVNEAILYEDIEMYDVAREKFEHALELCGKYHDKNIFSYVLDEFSRLLEKTRKNKEALKKLYFVEKYYIRNNDLLNLRNVRNRIGLNLCDIGEVKEGTKCLEHLYFGEFNGKINASVVLNCEVANNLSICYMESGLYDKALSLQDDLYRIYLGVDDAPKNYATDILQNKGNVYLYKYKFNDAERCFEQALTDEENPYSRQCILENYLYAKSFSKKDFNESITFFESIVVQDGEKNYETCKMLAEMYYANECYDKCSKFCEEIIKELKYVDSKIIYFSLDNLWIRCMIKLKRLSILNRIKVLLKLYKYRNFIGNHIGLESPYYREIQTTINLLKKDSN